jgi:hypothetical protein
VDSAIAPAAHSHPQEEVCFVLVDPSQHPRDRLNEELNKALNRDLNLLKYFFSRLVQRLGGLLQVLHSHSKPAHLRQRHCGGGDGL